MNVVTTHVGNVAVLRVQEQRLTYPILADFATVAADLIAAGEKRIILPDRLSGARIDNSFGCGRDEAHRMLNPTPARLCATHR